MNTSELYLKTIFCCMACDGNIAKEEIALVNSITSEQDLFKGMNIEATINGHVTSINSTGTIFLKQYLKELEMQNLSKEEQMKVVTFALLTIFADSKIEYSEVKFFKKIRSKLSLTDEQILSKYPDVEEFLLPDINEVEELEWSDIVFSNINFAECEQERKA